MTATLSSTPLSVLDRSSTRRGRGPAAAPRDTVAFARRADALGYHRFWVAEHHSVPGVAGSAPTVLAAAVAAATDGLRVGTGGVMLPNHRPLVVAEQFGVLESLYPGRIDMGLGRSVAFTAGIRRALGRDKDAAEDFPAQVGELLGYFTGEQDAYPGVRAIPAEGLSPAPFILATGAGSAFAAEAGLPLVIAAVRGDDEMVRLIDRYRAGFRPSAWADRPHVVVSRNVAVAATPDRARHLLVSEAWAHAYSRTHGVFPPLDPADDVLGRTMSPRERERFDEAMEGHVHGTEDEVTAQLDALIGRTGADEVLITTSTFDREAMADSYARLARAAGLAPRRPAPEPLAAGAP
ncbi:luciferase family oxidoreductase group 1 [Murinocardiopsis flavida]|uniref:Luciferase family oxidoreductase group 1 n=1 Tax=Murinocardiopsis flavida TaxID=645275 RepID=A0A2P8CXG6_9ACTN|nr:MsnO8 family LLM class oxidoreductase [Murinocardiopsis flavida]PSK89673.1 luciferase family oxidoreductase group 1 [Murinocardiopsis flavida]